MTHTAKHVFFPRTCLKIQIIPTLFKYKCVKLSQLKLIWSDRDAVFYDFQPHKTTKVYDPSLT